MFTEKNLRNGKSVNSIIFSTVRASVRELLSTERAEGQGAAGAHAIGFLTRLVKTGEAINDVDSVKLLKDRLLLEPNGGVGNDVEAIIDAMFEGFGIDAVLVDPIRRD